MCSSMTKQASLKRWLRPVGNSAPAQPLPPPPQTPHTVSDVAAAARTPAPQRRTTLLDVLSALDVSALRTITGHLEAAKSCSHAREACKALRDAVDTGAQHIRVHLCPHEHPEAAVGGPAVPPSLLSKWPSCTSLKLVLEGGWEEEEGAEQTGGGDEEDEGEDEEREEQEEEEEEEEEEAEEAGEAQQGAAGRPQQEQQHRQQQEEAAAAEKLYPLHLATWLFQGLPAARRAQIRELELDTSAWEGATINLSHLVGLLGPLLPGLQHIDLVSCDMSGWQLRQGESGEESPAALAAAFPKLHSAALYPYPKHLDGLAAHMGNRLVKLELRSGKSRSTQPQPELWATLPRLVQLKTLVIKHLDCYTEHPSQYYYARREGVIAPSEQLVVQLFDALPPALETLHVDGIELDTSDEVVGRLRGKRLELGLRDGRVQVVRVGWEVQQHRELYEIDWLLHRSKLVGEGSGRLQLLQLAGLPKLGDDAAEERYDYMWEYVKERFERFELGRLHIESGTSAEAMVMLALRYRPEMVVCAGCVVRLRGRGPPPSWAHVLPRWSQDLGGAWAEEEPGFTWVRPALGVAEAVAAGGLRLETAHVSDVQAAMGRPIRDSIAVAVAAVAASEAGKGVGGGQNVGCDRKTSGIVLAGGHGCGGQVMLLVGTYLSMLTTEAVTEAWVKALCQRAESLREWQGEVLEHNRDLPDVQCCVRVSLQQQQLWAAAAGGKAGVASGAGAAAAASAAAAGGVALLLQFSWYRSPCWVERAVREVCAPCDAAAVRQGAVPGLLALRLQGDRIDEVLHDAYLSPVGIMHCITVFRLTVALCGQLVGLSRKPSAAACRTLIALGLAPSDGVRCVHVLECEHSLEACA